MENTQPGKVTDWMLFAGIKGKVTFDLQRDFHMDIRGTRIYLKGHLVIDNKLQAIAYMQGFVRYQASRVGDIRSAA